MNVLDKSAGKDPVNNPNHYTAYGIECIEFSRHMHSAPAQAFQYIWRADLKGEPVQDLEKAAFWLRDWVGNQYGGVSLVSDFLPKPAEAVPHTNCIDYSGRPLVSVAGHLCYNLGRALELIHGGHGNDALVLVEREIKRRKASTEVAPVPADARSKRVNGRR